MDGPGRVVVGVDDSPGGRDALTYALHEAARRDAVVEVVAAFAPPDYPSIEYWAPQYGPPPVPVDQLREEVRRDAERIVEEVAGALPADTPAPRVTVRAVSGGAADALLHAAEGADLLVVGSRGRGGFRSMLLGSVGLACALHAPCPVTVVRSPKRVTADEPALTSAVRSRPQERAAT